MENTANNEHADSLIAHTGIALKIISFERKLSRFLNVLVIALICTSAFLACLSVFLRFAFSVSYSVIEELCRYAIVYAVMLIFGPLITRNAHLNMGLITDKMSPHVLRFFDLFMHLAITVVLFVLFLGAMTWENGLMMMGLKTMSGSMEAWLPSAALPIGLFIASFYAALRTIYRILGVSLSTLWTGE